MGPENQAQGDSHTSVGALVDREAGAHHPNLLFCPRLPSTFLSSSTWRESPAPARACPNSLCKTSIFSPSSSSISSFSIRSCRSLSPDR